MWLSTGTNIETGIAVGVRSCKRRPLSYLAPEEIVSGGYRERLAKVKAFNDKHVSLARAVEAPPRLEWSRRVQR